MRAGVLPEAPWSQMPGQDVVCQPPGQCPTSSCPMCDGTGGKLETMPQRKRVLRHPASLPAAVGASAEAVRMGTSETEQEGDLWPRLQDHEPRVQEMKASENRLM